MSPGDETPPPGIGVRDDDVVGTEDDPGHLDRWLNLFRDAWADGATRPNTQAVPGVPHVGRSGDVVNLSKILSMTATADGHHFRRYLAGENALGNLLGLDTSGLGASGDLGEEGKQPFSLGVLEMYDDTAMDALVGGSNEHVSATVQRTMTNFRALEWQWDPARQAFVRQTEDGTEEEALWNDEVVLGTSRSAVLQKQRRILADAITNGLGDDGPSGRALDVHVANLLFQDLDPEDDVLPVVDDGVQDHVLALLTEDYDTIRKMGTQLEYDDDGRLSNEFKKESYLDVDEVESRDFLTEEERQTLERMASGQPVGGQGPHDVAETSSMGDTEEVLETRFVRSYLENGEELDLFTENATLDNVGDDAYSLLDGPNPLANYRPGTPMYMVGMTPSVLRDADEQFTYDRLGVDLFYPMRQRRARFEKLSVLHRLGMDDRYEENPALLRSLAHHLFRFSLLRARHSAVLRQSFLDGQVDVGTASEFTDTVSVDVRKNATDDYVGDAFSLNEFLDRAEYPDRFHRGQPSTEDVEFPLDLGDVSAADDPRLEQVGHSLRYLQAADDETVDRLVRGTLDLASHRFDAWWTSIATRRLADHRHDQGNWFAPERTTYRNESGENVWADADAYVPPGPMPEWPPESVQSDDDEDEGEGDLTDTDTDLADDDGSTDVDAPTEAEQNAAEATASLGEHDGGLLGGNDLVGEPSADSVSPSVPLPESSAGIHVGAWGFVEDLHPDEGDDDGEFVHAPSLEQATTAAVLRGGHRAYENQDDGNLSAVDLSSDRVRVAKQVLEGVREGQPLGALLGYRFERGLHEAGQQQYIQEFRRAYPTFTGTLGGPGSSETAARSDVVDGYRLYRSVTFDDGTHTIAPTPPRRPDTDGRPEVSSYSDRRTEHGLPPLSNAAVAGALWHLFEAVDAVRDVLTAESVHQFTQGNYSRAKGSLEALARGDAVPEPQVVDTPRTSVGLTHRLLVTFGDADGATTPAPWRDDTTFTHPAIPPADSSDADADATDPDVPAVGQSDGFPLQVRPSAEPNLDAWVGELLPDPGDVGCEASYRWTAGREFAAGRFRTPTSSGRVSVADVGFEPDVLVFTASVAAGGDDDAPPTHHGWGHGSAKRDADGSLTQRAVSTVYDTAAGATVGTADTDDALHLAFDGSGAESVRATVAETTTDGFEFDVTVEGGADAVTVEYLALSVTDPGLVAVGHFETQSGDATVPLGVDADTVVLTATDAVDAGALGAQGSTIRSTGGAVGVSHGHVTAGANGITQHALSVSRDPAGSETPTATARDDRVVHLPGDWSLSCTGLGTDLRLSATSTGGTARPVTYVAMQSPPDEPTPEVGVLDAGENALDGGFRPGAVEFVALPGVTASDLSDGADVSPSAAVGLGHGLTTGVGRQLAMGDAVTDGSLAAPTATGAVVSVPTGASSSTSVKLTGVDEGSFTVEFTEGDPADCLVVYRAWPAAPVEREFVADTTLTVDELGLSPLDVLAFSKEDADAARTQLEEHIAFYLSRNRETKPTTATGGHPPIPDDATVELRFREDGGALVSTADFLELVRTVRDTVADGRAATADDYAHPAEQAGPGYDEATYAELHARADATAETLADVTALVDDRLELLDVDRDPTAAKDTPAADRDEPNVCEQVDDVQDAVSAFRAQVPISGVEEACGRVGEASSGSPGVLQTELERLLRALPAGPTDPGEFDEALTVEALAGRTLGCETDLDEPTDLSVTVVGTTAADGVETGLATQYVETRTVRTDDRGAFSVALDCHDLTPGATVLVVASSDETVVYAEPVRVVEPRSVHVLDPEDGEELTGRANVTTETSVTVTVTTDQDGDDPTAFDATTTTTTRADGTFGVTLDLTDVVPGTAFSVTATDGDGNEVYDADGHVRDPAYDTHLRDLLADMSVLPQLLWLAGQQATLDPAVADSPADVLQARLASGTTDWSTIGDETALVEAWKGSVDARSTGAGGASGRPAVDVSDDDVAVLDALERLETLDLGTLAGTLSSALVPLTAAGVDDLFDLTGGEDRVEDARFWPTVDPERLAEVRTALAQLLRNPAGRGYERDLLQFAPEFVAAVEATRSDPAGRAFVYLDLLFADAAWAAETFDAAVDAPRFLGRLRRFVAYPESFDAADRTALDADFDALADHYRAAGGLPGLGDAVTRAREFAEVLDRDRIEREMEPTAYDTAVRGVERILDLLERFREARTEADVERGFEALEEPMGEVDDVDHLEPTREAFDGLSVAVVRLRERTDDAEPWRRFERFDERFEDADAELGVDGRPSNDATPSTEFVAVLESLGQSLREFDERSDAPGTEPVFQPATARAEFRGWWDSTAGTLRQEVTSAVEPLATVARSTRLDETFRRCVLETLRIPLLRASYAGVYASTPRSATGGTPEDERTLLAQARGVSDRLHRRLDAAGDHADAVTALVPGATDYDAAATTLSGGSADPSVVVAAAEHERDRLTALLGDSFVVLPPLSPPNQAELSKTFAGSHTDELLSAAAPMETETWLQRSARVRDRPANLQQTFSYAEMVSGRLRGDDLRVGQLPYRDPDDWVGIDGLDETPERGRVSMVTTFPTAYHADHPVAPGAGGRDGAPGAQLAGFLVDDWRESVPATEETTGVAVNYDDPSTEPPQSILLAVPPDDGEAPWSTETLLRTVLESVDLAKMRGVDLDVVGKPRTDPRQRLLGQLLPALTFPHNTRDVPDTPTVDFDLDRDLADDLGVGSDGGDDR
ncbi:hypothetical protein [Haloarchaeobius sp. HRN-SO-5]|uniref:hypothetical protein n=1 Tax=Haloarchaeobius sp. HRN-SO-5 TaxID=3446118 RepID=UPI003EB91B00